MLAHSFAALSIVACLASCGGDTASGKSVDEACLATADAFAASPGPGETASSHTAFLAAADKAVKEAAFPIRDRSDDSDDWALHELASLLDSFPSLVGRWSIEEVAWRSRATVVRIAEVAAELGEPSCSAETFRLDAWESLTEQLTPPPANDSKYLDDLETLCSGTIGAFSLSTEAGAVGDALNWVAVNRALQDFAVGVDDLAPSAPLVDRHVELLAAAESLDALLPDVAVTIAGERLARIEDTLGRMDASMASMGVDC